MAADCKTLAADAAVIRDRDQGESGYEMFRADEISVDGAFLTSSLLLEVHESFTLMLIFDGGTRAVARAQVTRVQRGRSPGMAVRFTELGSQARAQIVAEISK